MNLADPKQKRALILVVSVVVAYLFTFCTLSFGSLVLKAVFPETTKSLTTEGSRLYVCDEVQYTTYPQLIANKPLYLGRFSTQVSASDDFISIQYGGDTYTHKGLGICSYFWSPQDRAVYFLEQVGKSSSHQYNIMRWARATGFKIFSKHSEPYFSLNLSKDGNSVSAMIYAIHTERMNFLYYRAVGGGPEHKVQYGPVNFRPVSIGNDEYLVEEDRYSFTGSEAAATDRNVVRWSGSSHISEPFRVGSRQAKAVVAIQGEIWVLFQENTYEWTPLMVKRGPDRISVARLNSDLTKVVEEVQFDPSIGQNSITSTFGLASEIFNDDPKGIYSSDPAGF